MNTVTDMTGTYSPSISHAATVVLTVVGLDLIIECLILAILFKFFDVDEKRVLYKGIVVFYIIRSAFLGWFFYIESGWFFTIIILISIPFGIYNLISSKANKKTLKRQIIASFLINMLFVVIAIFALFIEL